MTSLKSLADLLVGWEERSEAGNTVALEELCRDSPELLDDLRGMIDKLRAVNSAMATERIERSQGSTEPHSPMPIESTGGVPLPSIPGYTIERELGRGGMGVVYLARQVGLERLVAIKMLPQGAEAERTLNRFRTEAEVIARLQHPNLIQIYEVGTAEGRPFFSMEYVPDGTLEEQLRGRPQPPREAARLIQILATAMHEAHRCGVVHRDLKPGNILLRRESERAEDATLESGVWLSKAADAPASFCPKITDFGLAKRLGDADGLTLTHSVLGTPCYMAPEQARGDSKHVAETTDIYSLGAILYELLTGRPPFKAATVWLTLQLVSSAEPMSPRALEPGVPGDLEVICLKCLEKSPAKRYLRVIELAHDLRRFLEGEPILARPTPWLERGIKWARRRPGTAAAIAAGIFAIAALFAGIAYHNVILQGALLAEQASATESRRRLVHLEVAQGNNALDRGDSTLAMLWFADALRLDDPARDGAHRLRLGMAASVAPSLRQIWFHDEAVRLASFDSGGARAFTFSEDGTVQIWDVETGAAIGKPLVHPAPVVDGAPGASGLVVTACTDGFGRIWDTTRGEVSALLGHQGPLTTARFDRAGRKIVTAARDGTAKLWTADGKLVAILKHDGPVNDAAFAAGGQLVVTAAEDHTARVWETEHGKPVTPPLLHDSRVVQAALSPDGTLVATASDDVVARVWQVSQAPPAPRLLKHALPLTCVSFNGDGTRLATGSQDATARIWDPGSGQAQGLPLRHESAVLGVSFNPDGSRIATCSDDNSARLWETATGEPLTAPLKHGSNVQSVAIGPRGRFILTSSIDGTARLWEIAPDRGKPSVERKPLSKPVPRDEEKIWWSGDRRYYAAPEGSHSARVHEAGGERVGQELSHGSRVTFAAFSPDGTRLVTTSEDCTARLWDAAKGDLLAPPLTHFGTVCCAAFSPDSRSYVITASADGTARVWDISTGEPVTPALRISGTPVGVAFPSSEQVQVRSIQGSEAWTWTWLLVSTPLSAHVLLSEAEYLSNCRIDRDRGLIPLDVRTLREVWAEAGPGRGADKSPR
jgi:eukaryotic-like serine/threonine-protein kinase